MNGEDFEALDASIKDALTADREAALRDMFAAAALGALIVRSPSYEAVFQTTQTSEAYRYADAMLKARKA